MENNEKDQAMKLMNLDSQSSEPKEDRSAIYNRFYNQHKDAFDNYRNASKGKEPHKTWREKQALYNTDFSGDDYNSLFNKYSNKAKERAKRGNYSSGTWKSSENQDYYTDSNTIPSKDIIDKWSKFHYDSATNDGAVMPMWADESNYKTLDEVKRGLDEAYGQWSNPEYVNRQHKDRVNRDIVDKVLGYLDLKDKEDEFYND